MAFCGFVPAKVGNGPTSLSILFRSLAEQHAHPPVAVVLSGTDSDGAQGLEEIKAAGGITMAQEPASAKFDGMPKNAIATGCVDFVMTPRELGKEMLRIGRHPYLGSATSPDELAQEEDRLKRIFRLLQGRNGTDFSRYKRATVQRRLARRMALRQVDGLTEYAELLRTDPDEVQALAQDFLIRVTGFFCDPETFVGLSETVFPALFEHRSPKDPLRIWVPGCASGEEAYSIAIVLLEYLGDRATSTREARRTLSNFEDDSRSVRLRPAGYYARSAVLAARSGELPQSSDLFGSNPATADHSALPLFTESQRVSGPWSFGNHRQVIGTFPPGRQAPPDLSKAAGADAGCTGVSDG
jgi:hypothetical protein